MINKYINNNLLYRYRKITKYAIDELINENLVISSGDTFNDSHDMTIGYDLDIVANNLLLNDSFLQAMANDTKRNKTFEERLEYLKSEKGKHVIAEFANILCVDCIKKLKSKFLIGCFTHKKTNQVMWSHYGDYGKGFVVGYKQSEIIKAVKETNEWNISELFNKVKYSYKVFDATSILIKSILNSIKDNHIVDYSETFISNFTSDANDDAYDNLFIKNPSWQYEKEIRLLFFDEKQNFNTHRPIAKIKPSVLIMGENISFANKYLLVSICKNKGIPIMITESCYKNKKYELYTRPLLPIEIDNLLNKSMDILKLDGLAELYNG